MQVPGQRGGNVSLCAAISLQGLLHHQAKLGPFNTEHIIQFLDALHDAAVQDRPEQPRFVVWDNVCFHRAALVRNWFTSPILAPLHTISKPHRRIIFGLEMVRI